MLTAIAVLVLLCIALRLAMPHLGGSVAGGIVERDGLAQLASCPATPNCHADHFPIEGSPEDAIGHMAQILSMQHGYQEVSRQERYLHVTATSRIMGFVDDVEFLLSHSPQNDEPILLVRSASRLGKSDLGANAKRVESLRRVSEGRL